MSTEPEGLDEFITGGAPPAPAAPQPQAPGSGEPPGLDDFIGPELKQAQYGSVGQQVLAGVEGMGQGFAGPVFTGAEKLASQAGIPGLTPEDQAARAEVNPWTHGAGVAAGMEAGALTGVGELGLVGKAAEAGAEAANLGKYGTLAVRGAIGAGLIQGGDELSKAINSNPDQTAASVLSNVGLASVLGGAFETGMGALFPKWWGAAKDQAEQGIQDFKNMVSGDVTDKAAEAPLETLASSAPSSRGAEVAQIASENNWPVLEGMVNKRKDVQWAERALLEGAPTIAAKGRREAYQNAFDQVADAVDQATGSASSLSETQVGSALKDSILKNLQDRYAPIKELYDEIEPYRQAIPVSDRSSGVLSRTIGKIIDEQGLVPGSERYNFVKTFADGMENVDNLQKLANFRTQVNRSAGPLTKDLAGVIGDKLDGVEERAIKRFADSMKADPVRQKIAGLIDQADAAKKRYSAFRDQLQTLGNAIGKKKIYGPQNFMDFLENLNPQALTRRLFNENNTEFAEYFAKEFPDEMSTMRAYQRAQIRAGAMKNGDFNPKSAIKSILGMEPETRNLLFSPEEIKTIQAAEKYLNAFPKAFNTSNTDNMREFRQFFETPKGAILVNLKDSAILAFIKAMGLLSPGAEAESSRLISVLGKPVMDKEPSASGLKSATDLVMNAIRGDRAMTRAVRGLVSGSIPEVRNMLDRDRLAKLDEKVQKFQENPELLESVGGNTAHYLPNHDLAMKTMAGNAVQYLSQIRPKTQKPAVFDSETKPSSAQTADYHRALQIAQQPLYVLNLAAQGRLTAQDIAHFQNLYPAAAKLLGQKLTDEATNAIAKNKMPPYPVRRSLSLLTGQTLDSGFSPPAVAANQAAFQPGPAPAAPAPKKKSPLGGLKQLSLADRASLRPDRDEN